jgi:hypothetical protein
LANPDAPSSDPIHWVHSATLDDPSFAAVHRVMTVDLKLVEGFESETWKQVGHPDGQSNH